MICYYEPPKKVYVTEDKHIKENIEDEVRYIDTDFSKLGKNIEVHKNSYKDIENQEPIKNNESIRVYHGCDLKTAVKIAKEGVSGKEWHPRKYSYESGMNPVGLFVSTSFYVVKEFSNPFGGSKEHDAAVIIEFTAKSNDLDTPVWNNSYSYFGQGSNPMPFKDKEERNNQKEKYNQNARNSEKDFISQSDNPAMASNIFENPEHQALFIGDLSPNMVKRFWVKEYSNGSSSGPTSDYKPMKRVEFLKIYGNDEFYVEGYYDRYSQIKSEKLYLPTEDFVSWEDFARRSILKNDMVYIKDKAERGYNGDIEKCIEDEVIECVENIKDYFGVNKDDYSKSDFSCIALYMWPKQLKQILGKEEYEKKFDRLGIGYANESKTTNKKVYITEDKLNVLKESLNNNDSPLYHFTSFKKLIPILKHGGKLVDRNNWGAISLTRNKSLKNGFQAFNLDPELVRFMFLPQDILRLRSAKIVPYSFFSTFIQGSGKQRGINQAKSNIDLGLKKSWNRTEFDESEEKLVGVKELPLEIANKIDVLLPYRKDDINFNDKYNEFVEYMKAYANVFKESTLLNKTTIYFDKKDFERERNGFKMAEIVTQPSISENKQQLTKNEFNILIESLNNVDNDLYHFTTVPRLFDIINTDFAIIDKTNQGAISLTRLKTCKVGYPRYSMGFGDGKTICDVRLTFNPKDLMKIRGAKIVPYSFYNNKERSAKLRDLNDYKNVDFDWKNNFNDIEYNESEERLIGTKKIPLNLVKQIDILYNYKTERYKEVFKHVFEKILAVNLEVKTFIYNELNDYDKQINGIPLKIFFANLN